VAKPEAVLLTAERSPIASRRSVDYPHRCVQEAEGGTPAFLFVNNRLEGYAPGTIEAVVTSLDY
jgi:hypothetical protein